MLACLSTQELEDYLSWVNFAKVTEYTISSPDELRRELVQVRTQGYAVDMQESVLGLKCVAAPIFSIGGRLEGALGVSAWPFACRTSSCPPWPARFASRHGYYRPR